MLFQRQRSICVVLFEFLPETLSSVFVVPFVVDLPLIEIFTGGSAPRR